PNRMGPRRGSLADVKDNPDLAFLAETGQARLSRAVRWSLRPCRASPRSARLAGRCAKVDGRADLVLASGVDLAGTRMSVQHCPGSGYRQRRLVAVAAEVQLHEVTQPAWT